MSLTLFGSNVTNMKNDIFPEVLSQGAIEATPLLEVHVRNEVALSIVSPTHIDTMLSVLRVAALVVLVTAFVYVAIV